MNNIVKVIESYGIELKKQGQLYVGLCPFHDDKNTPNLMVYESTQSFCCYACQKAGDTIKFIALIEGKDYDEVKKVYIDQMTQQNLDFVGSVEHNTINFKSEVMLLTADVCRDFLHNYPDKSDDLFKICQKLDEKLCKVSVLDYLEGMKIVEKFKILVYSIGGTR